MNKDSPSNDEWSGNSSSLKSLLLAAPNCSLEKRLQTGCTVLKLLGTAHSRRWQSHTLHIVHQPCSAFNESGCFGMQPKMGSKLLLKLNIRTRPIANKCREGKINSTLKRKLIVHETVEREAHEISNTLLRFMQFCVDTCIVRIRMNRLCLFSDQNCCISQQCASTSVGTEW